MNRVFRLKGIGKPSAENKFKFIDLTCNCLITCNSVGGCETKLNLRME